MVQGRVGLTGIMRRTMEKMARCHGQDETYVESRWGTTPVTWSCSLEALNLGRYMQARARTCSPELARV